MEKVQRVFGLPREIRQAIDFCANVVDQVTTCPLLDGVLLPSQELATSATNHVTHKLGRTPRGYLVIDQDANARIWRVSWDTMFLDLQTSATVSVRLWVF